MNGIVSDYPGGPGKLSLVTRLVHCHVHALDMCETVILFSIFRCLLRVQLMSHIQVIPGSWLFEQRRPRQSRVRQTFGWNVIVLTEYMVSNGC